ncbi:MAG: helix-turn-helix transcriptional regulator [Clostridia bacterium]|nr:helix-turn-helix transcriptional regulator [Clostridia bacterium]
MINYGESLKYWREIKGLTQSKLAKETGLKQQMISWWEAGKGLPNIDFCVQLADFYGISLDELVGRDYIPNGKIENKTYNITFK